MLNFPLLYFVSFLQIRNGIDISVCNFFFINKIKQAVKRMKNQIKDTTRIYPMNIVPNISQELPDSDHGLIVNIRNILKFTS